MNLVSKKAMFARTLVIAALSLTAFAFSGCDDDDDVMGPVSMTDAQVRVAHLSPDAPAVDVWVDGTVVLEDVPFGALSDYLTVPPGDYQIQVTAANATEPVVIDATVTLAAGSYQTVAATGLLADIEPLVIDDDPTTSSSFAKVRFVHTSPDAPAVDITLTDGTVLFGDVPFGAARDFISVAAGSYDLQVRVANTETVALSFGGVALETGKNYTVFATGLLADGSISASVAVDQASGDAAFVALSPAMAQMRVAHLSPDAPAVDVHVDGALVPSLTNVPFQAVSGYLMVSAATHSVEVFATGDDTNAVISADVTLLPDGAFTIAATGLLGGNDLSPIVLIDDRDTASAGNSGVRFVHTSPDAPMVDVAVVNGPTIFSDVAFRQNTDYASVAAGTYDLEVRLSAGGSVALTVPGVVLDDTAKYTIFAVGLAGDMTLSALAVSDTP